MRASNGLQPLSSNHGYSSISKWNDPLLTVEKQTLSSYYKQHTLSSTTGSLGLYPLVANYLLCVFIFSYNQYKYNYNYNLVISKCRSMKKGHDNRYPFQSN